jgi:hypothetical protein
MAITDLVIDTLHEDSLESALTQLGNGRLMKDPDDPEEPLLTPDGYLIVRLKDMDGHAYARELHRRVRALTVIGVYKRTD